MFCLLSSSKLSSDGFKTPRLCRGRRGRSQGGATPGTGGHTDSFLSLTVRVQSVFFPYQVSSSQGSRPGSGLRSAPPRTPDWPCRVRLRTRPVPRPAPSPSAVQPRRCVGAPVLMSAPTSRYLARVRPHCMYLINSVWTMVCFFSVSGSALEGSREVTPSSGDEEPLVVPAPLWGT